MVRPRLIPFNAEHLAKLENYNNWTNGNWRAAFIKEQHPAFTGMLGNEIIGCAGVTIVWEGFGIAWVVVSKSIEAHGLWLVKTIRHVLNDIIRSCNLHRVEAAVIEGNEINQRFIEMLGFVREGSVARYYTSNQRNVIRYERING